MLCGMLQQILKKRWFLSHELVITVDCAERPCLHMSNHESMNHIMNP